MIFEVAIHSSLEATGFLLHNASFVISVCMIFEVAIHSSLEATGFLLYMHKGKWKIQ